MGPVRSVNATGNKKKDRRGRMARQPRAEAGDGYGTIGQQTDRKGWIAGWQAPQLELMSLMKGRTY